MSELVSCRTDEREQMGPCGRSLTSTSTWMWAGDIDLAATKPIKCPTTLDDARVSVSLPTAPPSFAPQELGITSWGPVSLVSDISSEPPSTPASDNS